MPVIYHGLSAKNARATDEFRQRHLELLAYLVHWNKEMREEG